MLKVALKSLLARKRRFLLTVFSVVLGVSFVAGTFIFTDSIKATFNTLFSDIYAGIDLTVRNAEEDFGESNPTFSEEVLREVQKVDGIEVLDPDVDADIILIDKEGEPIISQSAMIGFSWTPVPSLTPVSIKDGNGRAPENPGEIVIDVNTAKVHDFSIGDTVSAQSITGLKDFELVGLMSFGSTDSLAGAVLSAYEFEDAQEFFDQQGQLTEIVIKLEDGADIDTVRKDVEAAVGGTQGLEVVTGDQQTQENLDDINEGLGFINIALLAFALVSIFVSIFIIYNTFRIIIAQRSKELALLRSIGSTRGQIIRMVVVEAIVIGLIASAIGIIAGVGLSELLKLLADSVGIGLPDGPLVIKVRTIVIPLIVGLTVTVISALLPAAKASRISPVQAMSDHENSAKHRSLVGGGIIGVAVLIVGTFFLLSGLNSYFWKPLELTAIGSATMFIGVTILSPLLARPFANIIGWPFEKVFKTTGEIAVGNVKRSRRRTSYTAAALMIGVALVSLISILGASVKSTIDQVLQESFPADFTITSQLNGGPEIANGINRELTADIGALDEIDVMSPARYSKFKVGDGTPYIVAVEPTNFDKVIQLKPDSLLYEGLGDVNTVYINSNKLADLDKRVGDSLGVEFTVTGKTELKIVGAFAEPFDADYIISLNTFDSNFASKTDTVIFANHSLEYTSDQAKAAVDMLLEDYPILQIQDSTELIEEAEGRINQLLALIWMLLSLAVLISVLGIANTLTLSISERQREIGMLRAIGMTKRQVKRTIRIESIIIALFGAMLGIAMGIFFGWALMRALRDEGLTGFVLPYDQLAAFLVFAIIAGIIAAWLPSRRAAKTDTLEAIKTE